jgi:polyphosphate kinase
LAVDLLQATRAPEAAPVRPEPEFLDRDLSWLEFNARVLHEAADPRNPLLERVRFLSIFASNLDEFFMKRVGRLRRAAREGGVARPTEEFSPAQVFSKVRHRVAQFVLEQDRIFRALVPLLAAEGIHLLAWTDLTETERGWANRSVPVHLQPLDLAGGHAQPSRA